MKYARTKDNIYEVVEDRNDGLWLVVKEEKPNNYNFKISLQRVIKQADKISPLCDKFVVVDSNGNYELVDYKNLHQALRGWRRNGYKIYGAIWTDKGLIYVAKLNEKRELELL